MKYPDLTKFWETDGEFRWADLGPTLDASSKNPNESVFTLVWVPKEKHFINIDEKD